MTSLPEPELLDVYIWRKNTSGNVYVPCSYSTKNMKKLKSLKIKVQFLFTPSFKGVYF